MFQLRVRGSDPSGDPTADAVLFQHVGPRQAGFLPFTYQFGQGDVSPMGAYSLVDASTDKFRVSALLRAADLALPVLSIPIPLVPAPYEASMFALDVDLRFHQLGQSLSDTTWQNLTRTNANAGVVTLPDAVVLLGTRDPLGPTSQVVRFTNASFLQGSGTQLAGPAAQPSGYGSIKSAKLMQEGLCSTFTSYNEIFQQIDATIRDQLYRTHGSQCFTTGMEYITLAQENLAAFLAHEPGAPSDARGGFLMNLGVNLQTTKFPLNFYTLGDQTCHINTTFGLEPYLDDYGVLNVDSGLAGGGVNRKGQYLPNLFTSELTSSACHGVHLNFPPWFINFEGAADIFFDTLAYDLPAQLRAIAESRQYFPPLSDKAFDGRSGWSCDPVLSDDRYTCPVQTDEQCSQAANEVQLGVRAAATAFGLSGSARDSLASTITEDDSANPGHLKRWLCVNRPTTSATGQACVDPHKGRCELIVPMKRVNTRPDGLESVFFDRLDDFSNAALALFFASFLDSSNKVDPTSQAYRQICAMSRPTPLGTTETQNYSVRTFASLHGASHRCEQDNTSEPPESPCARSCADLTKCFETPDHPPPGTCGP